VLSKKLRDLDVDIETKQRYITKKTKQVISKQKVKSISRHPLIDVADPADLTDDVNPKHILNLRHQEFNENLKSDIYNVFKTLEKEKPPLKLVKMDVGKVETGATEISKTVSQRFSILLRDDQDKEHKIVVDLPYMGPNGTFTINGQEKALVTQIVTYPIFFFNAYQGKFQSSYSTFTIESKHLKNTSYLQIFFANYKLPLFMLLSYKIGFNKTMDLFDIEYKIVDEKPSDGVYINIGNSYIVFPQKLSDVQSDLIESLNKSVSSMPKKGDITSTDFWKETISKSIGNRSALYYIDKSWDNIVTPIEQVLLESRNDPTELTDIIKYISGEVVNGRVDDRNDVFRLRLRISELFTSQLQKQVKAAYTEYMSKRMGGDPSAEFYVNPKKVRTEIIQSQNVQTFESINPLEELSMMMRITPVGIGGIPNTESFPERARNIHSSYYGMVDTLETPDGAGVGIQQHLAIGANLTNARGMFSEKDRANVPPSAILGTTAAMVPFVNHDEGARIVMAVGQAKQAFPLKEVDIPCVQTGYESILANILSDNFIKKSPVNGVIKEITSDYIVIKDSSNKDHVIDVKPRLLKSGQGKNGLSEFRPIVLVGQRVKDGQPIAEGANIKEGTISNGRNLLCAFMPWKGRNFEDGMVVSESAAAKFVSLHNEQVEVLLTEDDDIARMVRIGDSLEKGDILISYSNTIHDIETLTNKRTEANGIVTNIEIYNNLGEDHEVPDIAKDEYNKFVNYYTKIHGKYPIGSFKVKGNKVEGMLIIFTVKQELSLTTGDKINNRHYNKGVISVVEPDENMPMTPWGERVDIIYNPISVLNRMNPGQLLETHVGLISKFLALHIKKSTKKQFISLFKNVLSLLDTSVGKRYMTRVITKLNSMSDISYKTLVDKVVTDGFVPIIVPPFKSPNEESVVKALKLVGGSTKYKLKFNIDGRNITTKPVSIGIIYVYKLEHLGDKKIHSRGIGPYMAKTLAPTQGKKNSGAAMIGEYDFYSLLAYDASTVIDELFGPLSSDHATKNEIVSEIIRTGDSGFRQSKTNPVSTMFKQYMRALHLKSD
jgi:DNA-directed RNA polymerase beta subunit